MRGSGQNSDINTDVINQQDKSILWKVKSGLLYTAGDSILALTGITLVTGVIMAAQLYPRIPSIMLIYLFVIIVLAGTRGHFAAILASLFAGLSFDIFLAPSVLAFDVTDPEDLLDAMLFPVMAIITGQLTALLRHNAEQAKLRERQTRLLSQHAQELAALRERQYLARELHDSVSQTLYSISLGAHTVREAIDGASDEAIIPLEYVIEQAEVGMAEMRALIFELHPESLTTKGVVTALTKQAEILRIRYRLTVNAHLGEEPDLTQEKKQALYRIAQEALHNIVKHAHASTVVLQLTRQDHAYVLEVSDNGRGFDPTSPFPGHLGLYSMQERAARFKGSYFLKSSPGQGTYLRVGIPIQNEPE